LMAMALVMLHVVKRVPSRTLLWGAHVILMLCEGQFESGANTERSDAPRPDGFVQNGVAVYYVLSRPNPGCRNLADDALALALGHDYFGRVTQIPVPTCAA
jgi:hypothetical protein